MKYLDIVISAFFLTFFGLAGPTHAQLLTQTRGGTSVPYPKTVGVLQTLKGDVRTSSGSSSSFGETLVVKGDTMIVGDPDDKLLGSVYVFSRLGDEWKLGQKIHPGQDVFGSIGDYFGQSVALYKGTLVVGAPYNTTGGTVSVYEHSGKSWIRSLQFTLGQTQNGTKYVLQLSSKNDQFTDIASSGDFGSSVAIEENTMVIGAPGSDSGAVFILTKSGGIWSQSQKLTAGDGAKGFAFGETVALDGDTLVISDSDTVYVSSRSSTGGWEKPQVLSVTGRTRNDGFGQSIALDGDQLIVSAVRDSDQGRGSGAAYIFTRSEGKWSQSQKITGSASPVRQMFGSSVAIRGDKVLVGAKCRCLGGSLYVFGRSKSNWMLEQTIKLSDSSGKFQNINFGASVAFDGSRMVVADPHAGADHATLGSVYYLREDLQQDPLNVAASSREFKKDESITLTTTGGSGKGQIDYYVQRSDQRNCSISLSPATVTGIKNGPCRVRVRKVGSLGYKDAVKWISLEVTDTPPSCAGVSFNPAPSSGSPGQANMMISLDVSSEDFGNWNDRRTLSRLSSDKVYSCLKDSFDYIFFIRDSEDFGTQYRFPVFDSGHWGSAGKLKGAMSLPSRESLVFGASLHEFAHNWANKFLPTWAWDPNDCNAINATLEVGDTKYWTKKCELIDTGPNGPRSGSHWGISSVNGTLGGYQTGDIVKVANTDQTYEAVSAFGPWANGGNSKTYAPLELYLMGLAPLNAVPPTVVFSNISKLESIPFKVNLPNGYYSIERRIKFDGTEEVYTPEEIRELAGHVPVYNGDVPKKFSILAVILRETPQNGTPVTPLSATEWQDFVNNWSWFTMKSDDYTNYTGKLKKRVSNASGGWEYVTPDLSKLFNLFRATKRTLNTYSGSGISNKPTGTVTTPGAYIEVLDLNVEMRQKN